MLAFALTRIPGMLPQNFSAAYALAFCGGVYFSGTMAWWLPLGAMLATDIAISLFFYHANPFSIYMLPSYLVYAGMIFLGKKFSSRAHWLKLLCGGLLGAIIFYIVTNTSSWIQLPYAKTLQGWIQALTSGLPDVKPTTWEFFRNTLLSGGLFTGLFVGAMKLTAESPREKVAGEREETPEAEAKPGEQPEEAKA